MKKEEVIEKIRENRDRIKAFGVKRIGIFGSVVRGEAKEESDIDFVVEFERGMATFKNVCGLIDFLEELFNREIDILTPDGIESIRIEHVKDNILREIEYV